MAKLKDAPVKIPSFHGSLRWLEKSGRRGRGGGSTTDTRYPVQGGSGEVGGEACVERFHLRRFRAIGLVGAALKKDPSCMFCTTVV